MAREIVKISDLAVTTAVDLFEIEVPTNSHIRLVELAINQSSDAGDAEAEMLVTSINRGTAAGYTSGSAGATQAAQRMNNASVAGQTWETGNTTQGTGATQLLQRADSVAAGVSILFPREAQPVFRQGEFIQVSIEDAPVDSLTVNAYLIYEYWELTVLA